MKKQVKIFLAFVLIIAVNSCSVHKDAFVNRKVHALKTRYNILFNGQQAFEKGLLKIQKEYKDNFWKQLPIEPITFDEKKIDVPKLKSFEESISDKKATSSFDRAEEKARKAIEIHSMNINGYEKNSQIDDAYLLLGKARYYTQRFIPAIDAFNYIIANYPNANLNYETRVWRAKANTRLGNEKIAIEAMSLLMKVLDEKEDVPKRVQEEAHTAMAMAYLETDTIQKAIKHLKKATETMYNKEQFGRNMFVLGQVYNKLGRKDSARMVFRKLVKTRRAPEKYRVHANIELVKNVEKDSATVVLIKRFKKLLRNSDNRKYFGELYYQLGVLEEKNGNTKTAICYFKNALKTKNDDGYQKTFTYEGLGDIYFKKSDYLLAGAYYDSVLKVVPKEYENEKRIRKIKRKNKGLGKLKKYEDILKNNDSILKIVAMSEEERTTFFTKHIEKLKKADEERRQQLLNSQNFGSAFGGGLSFGGNKRNKGKWYFYNTQSKQFGKADFERVWGNRKLEDNWRLSDRTAIDSKTETVAEDKKKNESRYKLATYLTAIPTNKEEIIKLKEQRNDALYQLGLIYKERFKNTDLAIANLERLKTINTDKDLELPIHYHLYQIYTATNNTEKASENKEFILKTYPFSKYADIINNPNKKTTTKVAENEIEKKYKETYYLYKNKKYEDVIYNVNTFAKTIDKSDLIPKFALLKALAIGKTESKDQYLKALEFIAFSYANTEEGKKAQEIIKLLKK